MFVFGSAANADDSNDGGGRGKASPSVDVAPSFAFDTSSLPAVTATPTAKSVATTAATGGFKFSVPPSQDLAAAATEGGEAGVTAPLFGGTFQSRQELLGAGVKTETKHEEAIHGRQQQQNGGSLPDPVTEEELMNSGHKLPEGYTCPLCCLPIEPPIGKYSSLMPCCMKRICDGCIRASGQRGMGDTCPFCRTPTPDNDTDILALVRKRVDAKDPLAIGFLASAYYDGDHGLRQDIPRAIELWTEAARLGDLNAHINLGTMFYNGCGVKQDVARGVHHWRHAAIQGHPEARHTLGLHEYRNGNNEVAVRHWMIAAKVGNEKSLNAIKEMFTEKGHATQAKYAEALKGYQTALNETKSPQRQEAGIQHWRKAAIQGHAQREEALAFFDGGDNM